MKTTLFKGKHNLDHYEQQLWKLMDATEEG